MWQKIAQKSNKISPEEQIKYRPEKKKRRKKTVVRASNSMTNQEFLAVAVMEGNVEKVKNVLMAYHDLFGADSFRVTVFPFI